MTLIKAAKLPSSIGSNISRSHSNGGHCPMSSAAKPIQGSVNVSSTEETFRSAVAEWTCGKGPTSSSTKLVAHPAFRRIVAMGTEAVPYLLQELKREPSLLVVALREITAENPVPRESSGKISDAAKAWVAWEEKNGLLR